VIDTGVGIPPEDIPKLFKLFGFIENRNSAMNKNGIGLGLTIAKSIVE
jgi:signal transduction histidine kinase